MGKKLIILIAAILGLVFFGKFSDADESPIAPKSETTTQKATQSNFLQPINSQEKVADQSQIPGVQSRDFSASVAGIDVNNDGVRDDIEAFIIKKYPDPAQRSAMLQLARADRLQLTVDYKDRAKVVEVATIKVRSAECAYQRFGSEDWSENANEILAMALNTKIRWIAYANFLSVGGYMVKGRRPGEIVCEDEKTGGNT